MYRGVEYSRTHLQAGEEVDVVSRVGDPHVEGLALLHDDAWWHERAAGVPQATGLALRDAVQLRQEPPQRLIGVHNRDFSCLNAPAAQLIPDSATTRYVQWIQEQSSPCELTLVLGTHAHYRIGKTYTLVDKEYSV